MEADIGFLMSRLLNLEGKMAALAGEVCELRAAVAGGDDDHADDHADEVEASSWAQTEPEKSSEQPNDPRDDDLDGEATTSRLTTEERKQIEASLRDPWREDEKIDASIREASVKGFENVLGDGPLHYAAAKGRAEVLQELIGGGADVNKENRYACTPLHYAADGACVRCLVGAGAAVDAKNKFGETPLHVATAKKNESAMKTLLEFGASVNARNLLGQTPLHQVALLTSNPENKHTMFALLLLRAGADPSIADKEGRTPKYFNYIDSIQSILEDVGW